MKLRNTYTTWNLKPTYLQPNPQKKCFSLETVLKWQDPRARQDFHGYFVQTCKSCKCHAHQTNTLAYLHRVLNENKMWQTDVFLFPFHKVIEGKQYYLHQWFAPRSWKVTIPKQYLLLVLTKHYFGKLKYFLTFS